MNNKIKPRKFEPNIAIKPSETILECFECSELNIKQFAKRMNLEINVAKNLLEGKKTIDNSIAKRLQNVFQTPASFWISLQKGYNDNVSRLNAKYRRQIRDMESGEELDNLVVKYILKKENIKISPSTSLNDLNLVLNTVPDKIKIVKNKNGYYIIGDNIKLKGNLCVNVCKVLLLNKLNYLIKEELFFI